MKHLHVYSITVALFAGMLIAADAPPAGMTLVKTFEGGKLYKVGGIDVVVLAGTYRQMGRQYGALEGDRIAGFYDEFYEKTIIKKLGITYAELKSMLADKAIKGYGKRQREILAGMAETSGMPPEKLYLVDMNLFAVLLSRKIGGGTIGSCTSMAAWGVYTRNGELYTARDYDYPAYYRGLAERFGIVAVFRPSDGSNSVAMLGFAGMVSFTDAMNSRGVYTEWNNGAFSAGLVMTSDRPNTLDAVADILFEADDSESFAMRVQGLRPNYPYILMLAGGGSASYFEMSLETTRRRSAGETGFIAAANLFQDPYWEYLKLPPSIAWYSDIRYANFAALAASRKGAIDEGVMMQFLDEPLFNADGTFGKGAAVLKKDLAPNDESTVYQTVTAPASRKMWVRIPSVTGWIPLDLGRIFEGK